jgi:four helix bundle protein
MTFGETVQSPMSKVQSPKSANAARPLTFTLFIAQEVNVMKIKKFEDLESWKKARRLTNTIYEATAAGSFTRDFGLKDQIRRASISILSNIAEGFERGGDKEFLQFLAVAKGSCGEVRAQLYIAMDQGYLSKDLFERLFNDASEIGRLISGLMKYLSMSELKGSKYR